jgi:hypothetical protein
MVDVADVCNHVGVCGRAGATRQEQLEAWYKLPEPLKESASCLSGGAQTVANEADVANVVTELVRDLVGVLSLQLTVRIEKTVLQWRPDYLLLTANGRIVGLIEVMQDGTADRDPFMSVAVAGQLLDYVQLLEQSGVSDAVAMLHTGKRAAVVACVPGVERKLQMTDVAATAPDVAKLTLQYLRTANALSISAPVVDFSAAVSKRLVRCVTPRHYPLAAGVDVGPSLPRCARARHERRHRAVDRAGPRRIWLLLFGVDRRSRFRSQSAAGVRCAIEQPFDGSQPRARQHQGRLHDSERLV